MSVSKTATTHGARDHARAKAEAEAAAVLAKPTIPANTATALPSGVAASAVCWDEILGPGDYASRILERGTTLRLTDLESDACISLLVFNADRTEERLNVADTVKVQWQAYPGKDALLLSDMGRVLLSIRDDTSGTHDAFCGASSAASNAARYGEGDNHTPYPNARDRFKLALARHGLGRRDICPCINLFRAVRVEADGSVALVAAPPAPGRYVELRAEMRSLVVLANTPHVLDRRTTYVATPVRATAWRGPVTGPDDELRRSTPERLRAFENVEDYYA